MPQEEELIRCPHCGEEPRGIEFYPTNPPKDFHIGHDCPARRCYKAKEEAVAAWNSGDLLGGAMIEVARMHAEATIRPDVQHERRDCLDEVLHLLDRIRKGERPTVPVSVSKEDKAEFAAAGRSADAVTDEVPPKHCGHCEGTRALCTCVCTICHTALHAELDVVELRGALQKANYDYWAVTHPMMGAAANPFKEGIVIVDDPKET